MWPGPHNELGVSPSGNKLAAQQDRLEEELSRPAGHHPRMMRSVQGKFEFAQHGNLIQFPDHPLPHSSRSSALCL